MRRSSIIMISFLNKLPFAFIPERTHHNTPTYYYILHTKPAAAPKLILWVASIIIVNFLPGVVPLLEISQQQPYHCADGYYFCAETKNYVNFPQPRPRKCINSSTPTTRPD